MRRPIKRLWKTFFAPSRLELKNTIKKINNFVHIESLVMKATLKNLLLERRLTREIKGEYLSDGFSRGRYATDASIYQMWPVGVVVARTQDDIVTTLEIASEEGVPVLARGGGTSQSGQTVNEALVIDYSKWLNGIVEISPDTKQAIVEPGVVLDDLNRELKSHGLWFPVDVSTASRATIGGMAGNNSCGARSIRYGMMRDNVEAIDATLANGTQMHFGKHYLSKSDQLIPPLFHDLLELGASTEEEIKARFPKVQRRVGGYNLDALISSNNPVNFSSLLVGSEGTLALSRQITLKLSDLPIHKVLGVCHFSSFRSAMEATQHIVALQPIGVELVDATMIALGRRIPIFRNTIEEFVRGNPEALLLVEFSESSHEACLQRLDTLSQLIGDLGYDWRRSDDKQGGVVNITEANLQARISHMRASGLNIMMSMKDAGKPVSFVEDCAVELEDLADYTERLTEIFSRHGTKGTWYAHASVGCLHVRPILNMKSAEDITKMRMIAEETFEMVASYKGSHSGEHGDGIVRSEFHERMFGRNIIRAFKNLKTSFDPDNLLNPGKIVNAPRMDDRSLMRYPPEYQGIDMESALDWSSWPGAAGGFLGAIEMCNNNGACRKTEGGVMCPSFRLTGNERDTTRGRANSLRLAMTGQLGPDALTSDDMMETLKLCVSCKACRQECPTGVDMARMKIEVLHAHASAGKLSFHDRLVGYLPRYAPYAARAAWIANLPAKLPGLAHLMQPLTGFSARRKLPCWSGRPFDISQDSCEDGTPDVVLLADTFNTYFNPEILQSAINVLTAAGRKVTIATPNDHGRPLCCGRTFLATGLVDQATFEAQRLANAILGYVTHGIPVIGLEPSCLFTLRDEFTSLIDKKTANVIGQHAMLFEEYLTREADAGRLDLPLLKKDEKILLHGHCHQKAFDTMDSVMKAIHLIPGADVELIETSCCGMAGAFGYGTENYGASIAMGELNLLPKVRNASSNTVIVADGTSCRQQIADGTGRVPIHVAQLLEQSLSC
jgi:FAD/FMN-containing dehydrogenase/Fe-S oxidoreductase